MFVTMSIRNRENEPKPEEIMDIKLTVNWYYGIPYTRFSIDHKSTPDSPKCIHSTNAHIIFHLYGMVWHGINICKCNPHSLQMHISLHCKLDGTKYDLWNLI